MHEMMTTPTYIHQFLIKLNEEAFLKVSFKKLHPFQNWNFSKNTNFQKVVKTYQKFANFKNLFYIAGSNLRALFNDMLLIFQISSIFTIKSQSTASTLEFLINMQHVYLILTDFSFLHALIRNYTFIEFHEIFTAYETSRYLLEKKLHFGNIFGKKSI